MTTMLTVDQLAAILNVPKSWIYARTRDGGPERLPHYKIGKYVRFNLAEIEDYLRRKNISVDCRKTLSLDCVASR